MKIQKQETIGFRVNPILKKKFNVAIGFIDMTNAFTHFMQQTVREYENQYGIIKVSACKAEQYELIANTLGVEIKKERIEELKDAYPKTRSGVGVYGN